MKRLSMFILMLVATGSDAAPVASGSFSLEAGLTPNDFSSRLQDYPRFTSEYIALTDNGELYPCPSWQDFAKIDSKGVDLCSATNKLGYEVQVFSRFEARPKANCVDYFLTIRPNSRPGLLLENVASLSTVFCLDREGKRVSYSTEVVPGKKKGLLYPLIVAEFKKLVPSLVETVQILTR